MWLRLTCAVLIELAYAVVTRVPLRAYFTGIERELLITACRLVSLFLFLFLFRELIFSRPAQPTRALKVGPITAVALVFMTPVFVGRYELADSTTRVVFAVTSIVVACKEECFYRGILQNILAPRVGHLSSVALSNVAFILYHYGAQPFTPWNIVEIFTAGCIFGLLYAGTGSLVLVIAVHAIDDAIWSFTPWLGALLPRPVGSALHITALIACCVWAMRSNNSSRRPRLCCRSGVAAAEPGRYAADARIGKRAASQSKAAGDRSQGHCDR